MNIHDDPTVADSFDLDAITESDYDPPGKVAKLVRRIDRMRCQSVQILKFKNGDFCLRWEERHPEMIPPDEYWQEDEWFQDQEKQTEYEDLIRIMPPKNFELPLVRREAFALIAACWMPEEFTPEIEALIAAV
jgi:hypothetical protein